MAIYLRGKNFWARWTAGGQQRRESLKTKDLPEAQRRFRELTGGALPAQERKGPVVSEPTVREILTKWFQYKRARSKPKSIEFYTIVRKRFTFVWGNLRPSQVTL